MDTMARRVGRCSFCHQDEVLVVPASQQAGTGLFMCVDKSRCQARLDEISVVSAEARGLVGYEVKLTLAGDPAFGGRTLRWGVLREVTGEGLVVDGYHDCSGVYGQYPDHRRDGNEVLFSEVIRVERYWRGRVA